MHPHHSLCTLQFDILLFFSFIIDTFFLDSFFLTDIFILDVLRSMVYETLCMYHILYTRLFDHQSNMRLRRVIWNPWQSNGKLKNMKNQSFEVLCHKEIRNARRGSKEKSAMKHS
ncbi:hypothetical protein AAG906_014341 [Vitis piasezkii]